jgi:uncharacterized membrane protein (UPF0136 family)
MNIAIGLYALLLLIGGTIGYLKAGSNMSLIMGTITAVIFAFLGLQRGRITDYVTLALTALMALFFSFRLYSTNNFFPSGIIVLASICLFFWLLRQSSCPALACCKIDKDKREN